MMATWQRVLNSHAPPNDVPLSPGLTKERLQQLLECEALSESTLDEHEREHFELAMRSGELLCAAESGRHLWWIDCPETQPSSELLHSEESVTRLIPFHKQAFTFEMEHILLQLPTLSSLIHRSPQRSSVWHCAGVVWGYVIAVRYIGGDGLWIGQPSDSFDTLLQCCPAFDATYAPENFAQSVELCLRRSSHYLHAKSNPLPLLKDLETVLASPHTLMYALLEVWAMARLQSAGVNAPTDLIRSLQFSCAGAVPSHVRIVPLLLEYAREFSTPASSKRRAAQKACRKAYYLMSCVAQWVQTSDPWLLEATEEVHTYLLQSNHRAG
jgi:hypothetical protein